MSKWAADPARGALPVGCGRYGREADMWSVGVILYILLSGTPPFDDNTLFDQIRTASYSFQGQEWEGVSDEAKDLVRKLLTTSPVTRLKADQVGNTHQGPLSLKHSVKASHCQYMSMRST